MENNKTQPSSFFSLSLSLSLAHSLLSFTHAHTLFHHLSAAFKCKSSQLIFYSELSRSNYYLQQEHPHTFPSPPGTAYSEGGYDADTPAMTERRQEQTATRQRPHKMRSMTLLLSSVLLLFARYDREIYARAAGVDEQAEAMAARAFSQVTPLPETFLDEAQKADPQAAVRQLAAQLYPFVLRQDSPCRTWPETLRSV
jgi:hypothetical protein